MCSSRYARRPRAGRGPQSRCRARRRARGARRATRRRHGPPGREARPGRASAGRRTTSRTATAEARAFLVRPGDEPHRQRRRAVLGKAPQRFETCKHVQAAVEPTSVRDRIQVPADHQHAVGRAGQGEPLIAGLVDRLGGAGLPGAARAGILAPVPRCPSRRPAERPRRSRSATAAHEARRRCVRGRAARGEDTTQFALW